MPRDDRAAFARIWSAGLVALVAVTFPLWLRWSIAAAEFPRITWFELPATERVVFILDQVAILVILIAAATQIALGFRRWCWWLMGIGLVFTILTDQARLQPWAYQTLLYALVLAAIPWREAVRWITAVAVSIYFFSALGKLDYQFVHTVGHEMIQTLAAPIGGVEDRWATKLALALPLSELMVAILLVFRRTRRAGGVLAIAMHLMLLLLLGPILLGHSLGVLTWNILLAIQAWILFVRTPHVDDAHDESSTPIAWVARVVAIIALLMPLAERSGYWDHWTSWALYSPHNSRAEIQVHESALDRFPESIRSYVTRDEDADRWRDLDIETWSLEQRLVPIYPQGRYQLAVGFDLARKYGLDQAIRAKTKSVAERWSGERSEAFLIGQPELEKAMRQYWLRGAP